MRHGSLKGFPGDGDVVGATGTCSTGDVASVAWTHTHTHTRTHTRIHTRTHTHTHTHAHGLLGRVGFLHDGEASPHAFLFWAPALMVPCGFELFSGWGRSHISQTLRGPRTLFSLSFLRFNIHLMD